MIARLALLLTLVACQPGVIVASPSPTTAAPTSTTTASPLPPPTATASPTPVALPSPGNCDVYQIGDAPIVPPRLSGRWLRVALDAVVSGQGGRTRWLIRFINPADAPASAEIAPSATIGGPGGPLQVTRYSAAPPNAGDEAITGPIELAQCGRPLGGAVVLVIESAGVTAGSYTITVRGIRRPEGDRADESWSVTCTADALCRAVSP